LQGPNPSRAIYREVWTEHKRWAIWGVPNVAARWFPINAYYVFMPALLPGAAGLAATAQLRVIMTLVMPMLQLQGALSGSLISTLSRRGAGSAGSAAGRVLGFVLAVSGAYALALGWAGPSIVPRIFGGHYLPSATSLWLAGLTLVASAAASVLRTTLLAAEQPRRVFIATTLSALATLSLGVWTSRAYGVIGAVLGMAAASSVQAAAMAFALRSSRHSRPPASNA
jgi:O-antigen/teichoic acid export membrane protein